MKPWLDIELIATSSPASHWSTLVICTGLSLDERQLQVSRSES